MPIEDVLMTTGKRVFRTTVSVIVALALGGYRPSLADEIGDGLMAAKQGDYNKALELFTTAAERGDSRIQAQMGSMFFDGIGAPVDHAKAIYWNSKAAESGRPDAAYRMGLAYSDPRGTYGIPENQMLAQTWFNKAVELARPLLASGDAEAEYTIGSMRAFGFGVSRDRTQGLEYLQQAADKGNMDAIFQVGELTVAQDEVRGKETLKKAADQGHSYAMYVLALVALHNGDRDTARDWLERSIVYRNPLASQKLLDVFNIRTAVPGVGTLQSNTMGSNQKRSDPNIASTVTGMIALSIVIGLATRNNAPDQQREAARSMADKQDILDKMHSEFLTQNVCIAPDAWTAARHNC